MPIDVTCGACGRAIKASDKLAGKKVKCPQCATIVAVPGPRSADTPPARPGPARPAAQRPAAKAPGSSPSAPPRPPAGQQPRQQPPAQQPRQQSPAQHPQVFQNSPPAAQPPGIMGVGDLLHDELTRDYQQRMAASEAEFERQQQEAIRYAYEAPKRAAEAMRRKGIHGQYNNARAIDIGFVFSRTWELYKQHFGMLLLAGIVGLLLIAVLQSIIAGISIGGGVAVGLLVNEIMGDQQTASIVAICATYLLQLANLVPNSYVAGGQIRYTLNLAKGQPAEFLDVLKGGPFIMGILSGSIVMLFIWLMPVLPNAIFAGVVLVAQLMDFELPAAVRLPLGAVCGIAGLVLLVVAVRLLLKRSLFAFAVVDLRISGADGMEISSRLLSANMGGVFLIYLCVFGITLLGVLTCIGALFTFPFCQLLLSVAFADITGAIPRVARE